ncbi:TspO/MBR family protein [Rhodovibrio salinarum]|uniref:Tryptophan-rich sensory protein n=1 Tax=Rhodovibrio salinarum TaxID=1087 RepID=A0A934UZI1_9PROT|nr:TspO/MBR family protein [Rhodovibrio salinarum]MBK1696415.1 tryptophan-rich sensory protein [Rhodovibrio salinarum]
MTLDSAIPLIVSVVLALAAAASGAIFKPGSWYKALAKPPWRPPDWLFGPVWMILYGMMAVAAWMVYEAAGFAGAGTALGIYFVHLLLNAGWSAVFFGMKSPGWGLVEVVGLWASIVATIVAFLPISTTAALLLLPYLVWVSFAAVLNHRIWQLNPGGKPAGQSTDSKQAA